MPRPPRGKHRSLSCNEYCASFWEKPGRRFSKTLLAARAVAQVTGAAGDVYLCHPFLVHAAPAHRGKNPWFVAQPPLEPAEALYLEGAAILAPVERATRLGLGME
jgi:hypothetical protein